MRLGITLLILVVFSAFSIEVALTHGYFGFITVAAREPWALQMLLDLVMSVFIACSWVRRDAKALGINPWPYVIAAVPLGSIGLLAYMVRRELAHRRVVALATNPT